jgi:hypothetical protein
MQTFTVKIAGDKTTAKEIKEAIWQTSQELSMEEIIVEEN